MNRLLIVDGSNLLFQMFFGIPSRIINSEGKAIQGTLGFVGALLKIIHRTEPTHIVVLFDGEHENKRTVLNAEVIVASFDSDFFQLITDNVSIHRGDNTTICTPEYLRDKFGIEPKQYADFKSLVGDNSDNIKGADKVGPKTASSLLSEFGNLENVLVNAEAIKKPSIRESIIKNADRLRTNYKLIKLEGTIPLPFVLEELRYTYDGITTNEVLKGIGVK